MKPLTIVAVALVCAIGLAMGFNFSQDTQIKSTYKEIADITPIVEYTPVSNWGDYNPAENWTGFSPYSQYSFTEMPDGVYSRYAVMPSYDPVNSTVQVQSVSGATVYTATSQLAHVIDAGTIYSDATLTKTDLASTATPQESFSLLPLTSIIATPADSKYVIDFDVPCAVPLTHQGTYNMGRTVTIDFWFSPMFGSAAAGLAKRVSYSPATDTTEAGWSGFDAAGNPIWYLAASDTPTVTIIYGGCTVSGYPMPGSTGNFTSQRTGPGPDPGEADLTVTQLDLTQTVEYMDIRYGITTVTTPYSGRYLEWSNGQINGRATFLIKITDGSLVVDWVTENGTAVRAFDFNRNPTGVDQVPNDSTVGTIWSRTYTVGSKYPAVLVTVDAIDKTIKVTPVISFIDFQTYTPASSVYTLTNENLQPFKTLRIHSFNSNALPVTFGIVSTTVATDPNGLLWENPVIDINSWFPTETEQQPFSIFIRSGTAFGDSITINNQTFPVENGYIVVDGQSYPLVKSSIDYPEGAANGHVFLRMQSGTSTTTVDLGEVQATRISATGIWYLVLDLRSITAESQEVLNYNPDGWDQTSVKVVLVLFMGLCTIIAMWAMRNREMSSGGIATVITAIAIAWIVLGAFV